MIRQVLRILFYCPSFLLYGLGSILAFQGGCASVGPSTGSDNATVSGGVAQVCIFCSSAIPLETITQLKAQGITEAALNQFFTDLGRKKIPPEALDHELRDIAKNYLDLKTKIAALSSEDPEVTTLIQQARQAVEAVNFPLAERLFNEASQKDVQAAQNLQQVATVRLSSAAVAQAANGDLQVVQLNFVNAQAYYQKALELLPPSDKEHRGQYLNNLGTSLQEAGIRTEGTDIQKFLRDAVTAYRTALTIWTKEQLPQQWAASQNNLGNILQQQGTRTSGEAGTGLLAEAVEAYRDALTVRTKELLPQDWAMTQNNLGNVLREQGTRASGEAGTGLLAEAVEAYRNALTVYTKDQLPQQWAMTQNNLGNVLREQGTRASGEAGTGPLAEAVEAYRNALTVYTKDQLPQQWAVTQNNLGGVLREQGTRTDGETGTQLLAEAVVAYRAALTIRTKEQLPQQWAMTQNNLGNVLSEQGTRTGREAGRELIRDAIHAYELALEVRTREILSVQWERTMSNLAVAKKALEEMK